jgi:hypothetical protein
MASTDKQTAGSWVKVDKGAGGGLTTSSPFSHAAIPVNPSPPPPNTGATPQATPAGNAPGAPAPKK